MPFSYFLHPAQALDSEGIKVAKCCQIWGSNLTWESFPDSKISDSSLDLGFPKASLTIAQSAPNGRELEAPEPEVIISTDSVPTQAGRRGA